MKGSTIPATIAAPVYSLLRLPEVRARTGLSRSAIYLQIQRGTFPAPLKIGQHASAWPEHEVSQWIADRIAERDAKAAA